ncbi:MAG TPA: molybdopterin-dependent oxidoreductase [Chitinophagaceae bacterium]|nr:molybdopterin-dependent oxidoreductase [Chitinophagaceae bacterium]
MSHEEEIISEKQLRKKTIISFSVFIVMLSLAFIGWKWLHKQPQVDGAAKPLRKVLTYNEGVFSNFFSSSHLAKIFPLSSAVKKVRVNGNAGLGEDFDASSWKLKVARSDDDTLFVTLDEIKKLPKTEIIFDFKCIEGWSQVTHWGGVKFSDFAKKYNLSLQTQQNYAGLITPDKGYYVGIDMPSIMHPQTLLCYEMNGEPLPMNQGYPLRLIIPVKYGIKHLKRIGTIFFSNSRPPDYWYEQGYDYYSGL